MATFRAGKGGRTQINDAAGNANLANQNWSVKLHGQELETSNFESNGRQSWLIGLEGLDWSVGALWEASQNQLDDPPGLYVRDDGTGMSLFPNVTDNLSWSLPSWMCNSSNMDTSVSGLVMFNASGKAQEDFVILTGSV